MIFYLIERSHFSASVTSERSHDQEKKHSNHDADVYHLWCGRLVHLVARRCIKSRVQWRWIKNQINRAYFEPSREVLVLGHNCIVCCTCPPRSNRSKDPFLPICLWPRIQFCRSSRGCWWNNPLKVHTTNYYIQKTMHIYSYYLHLKFVWSICFRYTPEDKAMVTFVPKRVVTLDRAFAISCVFTHCVVVVITPLRFECIARNCWKLQVNQ